MLRRQLIAATFAALALSGPAAFAQAPEGGEAGRTEVVSDQEKLARSTEAIAEMRQSLKAVLQKLEEARASKDVVKLNCVNEKLTNIKGLLRVSEQADISLQEAVAKREGQAAEHEYTKVTIARGKVQQLRAEAEQCVGLLVFEVGDTKVVVEEPQGLPANDPTITPTNEPVVGRPPPASPTD